MSIEQDPDLKNVPPQNIEPTSIEQFDAVYPKPVDGQAEPVIRPDVDEDSLGYN